MEKPVEWVWYGRDNDGESHISLGRWQRHPCQMCYKLAEIQPTEHDRAIPTIDPAAIRDAALREAIAYLSDRNHWDAIRAILILIGKANSMIGEKK